MMKRLRLLSILVACSILLTGCQRKKRSTIESEFSRYTTKNTIDILPDETDINNDSWTTGEADANKLEEIGDYLFRDPIEVESTHIFEFAVGDVFDQSYKYSELDEHFNIYTNPLFTMYLYPTFEYDYTEKILRVSPPFPENVVVPSPYDPDKPIDFDNTEFAEFFKTGEWGSIYSDFYFVQRVDIETYEKLEKPIVTPFHIRRDTPVIESRYEITDRGILRLSWEPVEGAQRYFIISVCSSFNAEDEFFTSDNYIRIIEQTTDTEWASDREPDEAINFSSMNLAMEQFSVSDDRLQSEDDPDWIELSAKLHQTDYYYEFGVVADLGGKYTSYNPIPGTELAEYIPISVARKAAEETGFNQQGIGIDQLPSQCPVTVSSGRTKLFTLKYDIDNALIWEGGGSIDYSINGTILGGMILFSGLQGTDEEVAQLEAKVASLYDEIDTPTGGGQTYTYLDDPPSLDDFSQNPENTDAETVADSLPYPINGSTEFVRFLAANMVQRQEWIDYSQFSKTDIPRDIWDAVYEAEYQNPMILWVSGYYNYASDQILYVEYEDKSTWESKQNEILAQAQTVLSQIILEGMSDREKAIAINDYLIDNCEYDYIAWENIEQFGAKELHPSHYDAWTPYGMLLEGTGVCASYSYTYKLLADLAGLNAIVVTGDTEMGFHAWNKVEVEGNWYNIDTTWNDTPDYRNGYLLLGDKDPGFSDHKEDTFFMLDMYISIYNTK